jgi:cyanophycinase-like exopeptidase
MILGGAGSDITAAAVRTGPGLGLLPDALIDMHFAERGRLPRLLSAAEAVVAGAAGMAITDAADAADAALARARAAASRRHALTTSRPQRANGSADYGLLAG